MLGRSRPASPEVALRTWRGQGEPLKPQQGSLPHIEPPGSVLAQTLPVLLLGGLSPTGTVTFWAIGARAIGAHVPACHQVLLLASNLGGGHRI